MDTRKIINQVAKDERIDHVGDLTIQGDVGENAQINLSEGSLVILGNIKDGAKITLSISEELRNSFSLNQTSNVNANVTVGSVTSCNVMIGSNTMVGNVNINNRIFTNDQLTKLGGNKYKVTPANGNQFDQFAGLFFLGSSQLQAKTPNGLASVKVDGKQYQGKEIFIDGKNVLVDGKIQSSENVKKTAPAEPPKLLINGHVGNVVSISSDADISVKGKIGNFCLIQSTYAGLNAKDIGEEATINVRNHISVSEVGKHCVLISKKYGLNADTLKNNSTVDVRTAINISGNIGNGCKMTSHQYGLTARNVGMGVIVAVRDSIKLRNIGSNSSLSSSQYGINANDIGDNVSIQVRNAISLNSMGNECQIASQEYGIDVAENVGHHCSIKVKDNINVGGGVGNYSQLKNSNGKIKITGNSGESITLSAKDSIHAKDIGKNSNIASTNGEVTVRNIGSNVKIAAREDIEIEEICPANANLNSQKGKIRKAPQPAHQPSLHLEEGEQNSALQPAIPLSNMTLSNAAIVQKQGLFPEHINNPNPKNSEDEIPEAYLCVITQELMLKPVICSLDGRTYEEKAIREWLTKNGSSPVNRVAIKPNQTIDDVLIPNRNLEEAIESFRKNSSSLMQNRM